MQLKLPSLEPPDPTPDLWLRLDPEAKQAFVDSLARAMAKAVRPEHFDARKVNHDR